MNKPQDNKELMSERELIALASDLQNHWTLDSQDHMSIMGFMNKNEMIRHVEKLERIKHGALLSRKAQAFNLGRI